MAWTNVPSGILNGANQRFWLALGDQAGNVANRLNTDVDFTNRLAHFAVSGGFEPSTSQKRAREIMGRNMFGVEEAMKHFGVNPQKQQLAILAEIPWREEVLVFCKDTHVLIAVLPMSILDIRGHVDGKTLFYNQDWYNKQGFAKDKGEVGWHLIRKEPTADSTAKSWNEQQALLSKDEEMPTAQIMVYTIIGHFRATGERLFERVYVRTSSLDSDGRRVVVGDFDAKGLRVGTWYDVPRHGHLGLSAARRKGRRKRNLNT